MKRHPNITCSILKFSTYFFDYLEVFVAIILSSIWILSSKYGVTFLHSINQIMPNVYLDNLMKLKLKIQLYLRNFVKVHLLLDAQNHA